MSRASSHCRNAQPGACVAPPRRSREAFFATLATLPGRRALRVAAALLGTSVLLPGALRAQSIQSGYGFGSLVEALPARAVALGGGGLALPDPELGIQDPTAPADALLPTVLFTSQSAWNDLDEDGNLSTHSSFRFPAIGVLYPVPGIGVASLSFAGVMDQNWTTTQERLVILEGGDGSQARVTDRFESEGGVSSIRVGLARRISPSLVVGATVGRYIGSVDRRFARTFDSLEVETRVPPYQVGGSWSYGGVVASLGTTFEVSGVARLSAAYTLGGDLDASPVGDTEGAALAMDVPSEFRVGGTVLLASDLILNGGLSAADWTSAGGSLTDVEGNSVLRYGGGVEWSGARLLGKDAALRFGYRRGEEPFRRMGDPAVEESAWTGGIGLDLLAAVETVLARSDLALERGTRKGGAFTEEFWRLTLSVRVTGR